LLCYSALVHSITLPPSCFNPPLSFPLLFFALPQLTGQQGDSTGKGEKSRTKGRGGTLPGQRRRDEFADIFYLPALDSDCQLDEETDGDPREGERKVSKKTVHRHMDSNDDLDTVGDDEMEVKAPHWENLLKPLGPNIAHEEALEGHEEVEKAGEGEGGAAGDGGPGPAVLGFRLAEREGEGEGEGQGKDVRDGASPPSQLSSAASPLGPSCGGDVSGRFASGSRHAEEEEGGQVEEMHEVLEEDSAHEEGHGHTQASIEGKREKGPTGNSRENLDGAEAGRAAA